MPGPEEAGTWWGARCGAARSTPGTPQGKLCSLRPRTAPLCVGASSSEQVSVKQSSARHAGSLRTLLLLEHQKHPGGTGSARRGCLRAQRTGRGSDIPSLGDSRTAGLGKDLDAPMEERKRVTHKGPEACCIGPMNSKAGTRRRRFRIREFQLLSRAPVQRERGQHSRKQGRCHTGLTLPAPLAPAQEAAREQTPMGRRPRRTRSQHTGAGAA